MKILRIPAGGHSETGVGNRNKTGFTSQPTPLVVLEHDSFLRKFTDLKQISTDAQI